MAATRTSGSASRAASAFLFAFAATPAHAQEGSWIASPYLHANFGEVEIRRGGLGLSAGYLGRNLGFELDVDRHEHFFKDARILDWAPDNCVPEVVRDGPCVDLNTDAWIGMANALVALPPSETSKWRPYGAAGIGGIYAWVHGGPDAYDRHQTDLAIDVGGGALYRLGGWVALRGDVRWFHGFVLGDADEVAYPEDYDYVRIALGVTLGR